MWDDRFQEGPDPTFCPDCGAAILDGDCEECEEFAPIARRLLEGTPNA